MGMCAWSWLPKLGGEGHVFCMEVRCVYPSFTYGTCEADGRAGMGLMVGVGLGRLGWALEAGW